jgi:hypothetical protein
VALIPIAEVRPHVGGPLIGLGEEDPIRKLLVEGRAKLLQDDVGLRQVLAVGSVALDEIRDRIEAKPIDAHAQPELHDTDHRLENLRIVEVEIGLMAEEPVPEELLGFRIPGPVGALRIGEDDARILVQLRIVRPHVEVALR